MKIFFRYDDFSERSPGLLERKLLEVFSRHNVSCLIGVVPYVCSGNEMDPGKQDELHLSSDKLNMLRNAIHAGVAEVALHGLNHQTVHPIGQRPSEFRGMSIEDQVERLSNGKTALESGIRRKVRFFIPPWNDYDSLTLLALNKCGFDAISTGKRLGETHVQAKIKYLPITMEISESPRPAKRVPSGSIMGILLHPYNFYESGDTHAYIKVQELDEYIARLKKDPLSQICCFGDLVDSGEDLSSHRYQVNWALRKMRGRLPGFLKTYIPFGYYLSTPVGQIIYKRLQMIHISMYGIMILSIILLLLWAGFLIFRI